MAERTYYAWAPIHHKDKDNKVVNLEPGDEVPNELVDSDAGKLWIKDQTIRTAKYPEGVPSGLSVRTHLLRKANEEFEKAQAIGSPTEDEPVAAPAPTSVVPGTQAPVEAQVAGS